MMGRWVTAARRPGDGTTVTGQCARVSTDRLVGCGFTRDRDPRLGEASELLSRTGDDGTVQVAAVIASEGVGLVLVASGSAAEAGSWDALADLALGSSCSAAAHGCH